MPTQAIGIDIGGHAVKVALLQRKGGTTRAVRLFRATLAGDTDPVRVQGAVARAGIRGGPGLLGISGRDLIIRYTHVPPVPDWRLKLLMQFEINEVSGQSGGEVAADYRRLRLPVEGEDTVLVALARNTWLSPRLGAAKGGGISCAGGCPNSVALFNAWMSHGRPQEGKTAYLVNIGRDNLDMAICRDGELLFARNMAGGGQLFTDAIMQAFELKEPKAEANKIQKGDITPRGAARYPDATSEKLANAMQGPAGQLVSMIQSTVMICRAQTKITDLNVDHLVLSGGGARLKGMREYFEANMSVPVELFDPVAGIDTSALPAEDQGELGEAPLDFAVAVGLAETLLSPSAFRLEVLTDREKKKRHFLDRTIWALGGAAAALALIVLLFQTRAADIARVREANGILDGQLKQAKKTLSRGTEAMVAELESRQKDVFLRSRRLTGSFARAIADLLRSKHPEGMFLVSFEVRPEKVSLGLDGMPTATLSEDAGGKQDTRIHEQLVWPVCEVTGEVQPEYMAGEADQALNEYFNALRGAGLPQMEGFTTEMKPTMRDVRNRFSMTFRLVPKSAEAKPGS